MSTLKFGQRPRAVGPLRQEKSELIAALLTEALKLHQAGRLLEAEGLYNQVLALRPDHFDALHLLGVISHQRGQHAEAVRRIDLALKRNPSHAAAHNNRGSALSAQKHIEEALASFSRAVALQPDYAEAHSNRGNALRELGRFEEAVKCYDQAIKLQPGSAAAYANRGNALRGVGRLEEAVASCDRALELRPDLAEAYCYRGIALRDMRRFDEALQSYDQAIKLRSDYAEAHQNRGNVLRELGRSEEALDSYDRAIALQPDFAEAYSNRGSPLTDMRRFEDALQSYDRAVELQPDHVVAHTNRGVALVEMGRFEEALQSYDRATASRPDYAEAHVYEAICRLLLGDLERGWRKFEWRWETSQFKNERRLFPQPLWLGLEDIAGKTILLHPEQGLGDTIQFARYAPRIAALGAKVILEVQSPLRALMSTMAGGVQIVSAGDQLPDFDVHCPLLSLPLAFGTRLDTIPCRMPYLSAPASKVEAWRDRLGERAKPKVGLVWAGNPRKELPNANRIDRERSIGFDRLAPLFGVEACDFYSLQKGDDAVRELQCSAWRDRVSDFTNDLHDFSDTAALIENLDLVISVDTSVLHVAGALGKPVWLLNRYNACWRWLREREDSPWYPTVRQFRQDAARDWIPVVARVAAALKKAFTN